MKRRNYNGKELDQLQRLKKENEKLKKSISGLRKMLARTDLDKFSTARDLIEQNYQGDSAPEGERIVERLKKEWACREPGCEGYLEIFTYNKINVTWYFRKCSNMECRNRTKPQLYTPEVLGIRKKSSNLD
jgi:hypothetical protein